MSNSDLNPICPIAVWYVGTSDPGRVLHGHRFSGYDTPLVNTQIVTDRGVELDAGAKPA